MTILAPQEVLQAIIDGKGLECRWYASTEWKVFIPTEHPISTVHIFNGTFQFRLAPEMVTIGDVSFPKPETKAPDENVTYHVPLLGDEIMLSGIYIWRNDSIDEKFLKQGLVHLSEENAIAHAKALINLSGAMRC